MEASGRTLVSSPFGAADLVLRHSSVSWRHWRTMAFFASRSLGIRKIDGLLVSAGELCGIVRASYLSPFFPFFLCIELWHYLRRQLPTSDRSGRAKYSRRPRRVESARSTANSPLRLRLLRGAAFALTLMLPTEGWAQDAMALEGLPLPDAPAAQQGNSGTQQEETSNGNGPTLSPDACESECLKASLQEAPRSAIRTLPAPCPLGHVLGEIVLDF
jgi:hypothetical protein